MLLETSFLSLRGGSGSGWTSPAAWCGSSCLFIWLAVRQPPVRLCGRFCTSVNVCITSFCTRCTFSLFFLSHLSPAPSPVYSIFPLSMNICVRSAIYWFTILSWSINWPLISALITCSVTKNISTALGLSFSKYCRCIWDACYDEVTEWSSVFSHLFLLLSLIYQVTVKDKSTQRGRPVLSTARRPRNDQNHR